VQLLYNLSGGYFINEQFTESLKTIEELQKIAPSFPEVSKLKSRVLEFIESGRSN